MENPVCLEYDSADQGLSIELRSHDQHRVDWQISLIADYI